MANQYTKEYTLANIKAPKDIWRRINRAIRQHPELHDQRGWHTKPFDFDNVMHVSADEITSCDTMHCVAGWGSVLTPGGVQVEKRTSLEAIDVFRAALVNSGKLDEIPGGWNELDQLFYNMNKDEAAAQVAAYARQEARNEKNAKLRAKRRAAKRA